MFWMLWAQGINWARALATGVIGAGIGVGIAGAAMIRKETEKRRAEGRSPMDGGLILKFVGILVLALGLIFAGIAWRSSVT